MRNILREIWMSVNRNKLRTFMTGFSVAWGIFMLIILLGSGNGLKNGVMSNFADMATNSVELYAGQTSIAHKGYQAGRTIKLNMADLEALKALNPQIDQMSAMAFQWGEQISAGKDYLTICLYGVTPKTPEIEGLKILSGRFVNELDMKEVRKVMVIDAAAEKTLFKGKSAVGQNVYMRGSAYTVIGVSKENNWTNTTGCYIPISTLHMVFNGNNQNIFNAAFTVNGLDTREKNEEFENKIRAQLAARHDFSPNDRNAVWIWNNQEDYLNTMMVFNGISIFVWIIGIGTLSAGIVGVSNIMLVTVRERTYEFGIRKALGARPRSIIALILIESVMITAIFGYIGMVLGIGVMELVNYFMERTTATAASESQFDIFKNPTVDLSIAFSANFVLVVAGLVAGYIPARRAARIKTIDALRFNK